MEIKKQKEIQKLVQEMNKWKTKAMHALQNQNFRDAAFYFNLDARNSDKLSNLIKEEIKEEK